MVRPIERGESSLTAATLWNLIRAPQVDYAGLLDGRTAPPIEVIRPEAAPVIGGRGQGGTIRILSPAKAVGVQKIHGLTFVGAGKLVSVAHGPGYPEHLTLLDSRIEATSGEESQLLNVSDTAHHVADRPHRVETRNGPARAILIVQDS